MGQVVELHDVADVSATEEANYWKRRQAAQVIAMLPDEIREAINILDEARMLILIRMPA